MSDIYPSQTVFVTINIVLSCTKPYNRREADERQATALDAANLNGNTADWQVSVSIRKLMLECNPGTLYNTKDNVIISDSGWQGDLAQNCPGEDRFGGGR
ncbi:MAG: hypothetical protein WCC12_15570 [Anaerolineales bacterium]